MHMNMNMHMYMYMPMRMYMYMVAPDLMLLLCGDMRGARVSKCCPHEILPAAYLLGLLAMIKCSICSYQCDN